ncbi:uncharacterized protein CC84DRAFT_179751 [Paraphaeosphaeria sporulosa]|uniref:Uncharacterized protein n=1 Tax=Paraphaeosphaeria sporulosa TaxID=1460663 RepID=A0A177D044_9PLEO|nr:uncharacterized protein CC84DRAFT_179751 [Paraphaeosphaeria sporulosa]OAG13085.1 hypothetical protein CC84DRAFT_179751 [Paraphaeosphaeria sporulosa]
MIPHDAVEHRNAQTDPCMHSMMHFDLLRGSEVVFGTSEILPRRPQDNTPFHHHGTLARRGFRRFSRV